MQEYLSDAEKSAVEAFVANKTMFDAVKKVVLHTIYTQGTLEAGKAPIGANWVFGIANAGIGGTMSNEKLGEELKAALAGLGYLEDGFTKLTEVKTASAKVEKKVNPAL